MCVCVWCVWVSVYVYYSFCELFCSSLHWIWLFYVLLVTFAFWICCYLVCLLGLFCGCVCARCLFVESVLFFCLRFNLIFINKLCAYEWMSVLVFFCSFLLSPRRRRRKNQIMEIGKVFRFVFSFVACWVCVWMCMSLSSVCVCGSVGVFILNIFVSICTMAL